MNIDFSMKSNAKQVLEAEQRTIAKILTEWGMVLETEAKKRAPVDTGNLRNSITYETDVADKAVYVGTNVEYAPYQEFGTSRMKAANDGVGYLRPAITDNIDRLNHIMEDELKNGT